MSFLQGSIDLPTKLGMYRTLSPLAGIRVSPLQHQENPDLPFGNQLPGTIRSIHSKPDVMLDIALLNAVDVEQHHITWSGLPWILHTDNLYTSLTYFLGPNPFNPGKFFRGESRFPLMGLHLNSDLTFYVQGSSSSYESSVTSMSIT
ncbi:hypothetical protein DFH07DRAFT_767114 [Mycena maculata]|uniref:Uncharacterized protein n=1 Tax=Mycena maculata TaxID=230809 RepID=A0AAD7NUL4_9AGAR|nr:hypothetical protein DFH07DRAFT_767114 [Mycena maculata]